MYVCIYIIYIYIYYIYIHIPWILLYLLNTPIGWARTCLRLLDKECGCIDEEFRIVIQKSTLFFLLANLNYLLLNAEKTILVEILR